LIAVERSLRFADLDSVEPTIHIVERLAQERCLRSALPGSDRGWPMSKNASTISPPARFDGARRVCAWDRLARMLEGGVAAGSLT
jgi:hypothetical protein